MTTDTYAPSVVGERIRELSIAVQSCQHWRRRLSAASAKLDTSTSCRLLWKCWSRRLRTGV